MVIERTLARRSTQALAAETPLKRGRAQVTPQRSPPAMPRLSLAVLKSEN